MKKPYNRWLMPTAVAGVVAIGSATVLIGSLGLALPVSLAVGGIFSLGAALLFTPYAPKLLEVDGRSLPPTTVTDTLDAVLQSAETMDKALRRLESRPLWNGTQLDEQIHELIGGARILATMPQLRSRTSIDGDVHMLYVLFTDYLPAIVNLVIESDRMHTTFSGKSSRAQVERNVKELEQQASILGEALDRIETDVVAGTTQSVQEHAAFLQLRFEQEASDSVLNLTQPLSSLPTQQINHRPSIND